MRMLLLAVSLAFTGAASAEGGPMLNPQQMVQAQKVAQAKGCMACHGVDKKIVGPSYKDIAAKYKGNPAVVAQLSQKVIKGGGGVWGPVPMPPNAVTPQESEMLTKWVLSH